MVVILRSPVLGATKNLKESLLQPASLVFVQDDGFPMNKVSIYKTEGLIIKSADLGELDRLLTIYTRGYGKIPARTISVRKKESKLKGLIEPFSRANFMLAKSKTIDIVTDVWPINDYFYLRQNLKNLAHAFYFAELIDKLVVAPERDENLWRLIERVFAALNQPRHAASLPQLKTAFEEKLLEFLGHPSFEAQGKNSSAQKLFYLQSLAGEGINSPRFLTFVKN